VRRFFFWKVRVLKFQSCQYDSFLYCMNFIKSIPIVSCGAEIFNGDNMVFRFKHSFMTPLCPAVHHCPHLWREAYACSGVGCEELACGGTPGDIEFTGVLPTECSSEECKNRRVRKVKGSKGGKKSKKSKKSKKGGTTSDNKVNPSRCASSW
jgi:hypothetical protein